MKVLRFLLVLALLFTLSSLVMAQTGDANQQMGSDQQMNAPDQNMGASSGATQPQVQSQVQPNQMGNVRATVQPGPVTRRGYRASADVFVGKRFAMRIASTAGGLSPMARARIIADRLNSAFASGMSWQDMRVSQVRGIPVVMIGDRLIATADRSSARALRTNSGLLASRWARGTVVAMGGQPQMVAMQTAPIRSSVAGSKQELGQMAWDANNTKSVPLMNASDGSQIGTVLVAGSSNQLGRVNSVALYQSTTQNATVWRFVPIEQSTFGANVSRVSGVGLVGAPSTLLPTTGYMTGADMGNLSTKMGSSWNSMINSAYSQGNLGFSAASKVVPLYSMDRSTIIGAAQVMGSSAGIRRAQAVYTTTDGDMIRFHATTAQCTPMMGGQPSPLNDVVVSAIVMLPSTGAAAPQAPAEVAPSAPSTAPAPESTQPGVTQPETSAPSETPAPSEAAPSTTAPSTTAPEGGTGTY